MNRNIKNQRGFALVPAILIVVAALIIGGGVYYLGSRNSTPSTAENSQTGNGNPPPQNQPITITSPSENVKLQIGSTQKISWRYSDVLKNKIQSSKNTLVLAASLESVEKLGNDLGRGGFLIGDYISSFAIDNLKTIAYAGQVMKSSEILNKTAIDWKIQDFPVSCPPGGICQGPIAEKNFEEMAKLVPGKYVITVCVYNGLEKYCSDKLTVELTQGDQTSNWKTYRNNTYGFSLKYPSELKTSTFIVDKSAYNEGIKILSSGNNAEPDLLISIVMLVNNESYGFKGYKAKEKIVVAGKELYIEYLKDESATPNNIPNIWHKAIVGFNDGDIRISLQLDKIPDNNSDQYEATFKEILNTLKFF